MTRIATFLALTLAAAAGGCTVEATGFAGDSQGYHETTVRASTREALVGPDGRCQSDVNLDPSLLRQQLATGVIPLGSTECEVVARLGGPYSVEIRHGPAGERLVRLMYVSGPRIGVYAFTNNRLTAIEH